jgi:hypothetical protein
MDLLTRLVLIDAGFLLCGFFGIVAWKIASGEISLAGLLHSKEAGLQQQARVQAVQAVQAVENPRNTFSPARLQLLIFTVVVAATYLHEIIVNPRQDSLPDIPQNVVAALGGSQLMYLAGKALAAYIQPLHRNPR